MIRPGQTKYDWEIELSDAKSRRRYGLKVPQGSLQIGTISEDDTIFIRNVGKRVGDFDEQRSWKGGRGLENLSENAEGFYDSGNTWTLTPGHAHQTLQLYHGRGLRNEDMYMPTRTAGDVVFQPLLGAQLYIANSFAASASYNADYAIMLLRRKGSPGTLTLRATSSSGGSPNTALQTVTKTITDVTDYVSVYLVFNWTGTQALVSGTTYWVSMHGATTDDQDNHWEVAVNPDTSSGKTSSDGSTWAAASFAMYYHIQDTSVGRRWFRFYLKEAMYVIDQREDRTTASVLYINGDRGKATAGAASSLTDSAKSWTTNRWQNAYIKIIAGTGVENLPQQIASNTGTVITVSGTWETNPSTDSEYIIYATDWFTAITPAGGSLSVCSGEPAVANNVAYIPQGSTGIAHLQWNNSTLAHDLSVESASGTNGLADLVMILNDPADGPVIWRANNSSATGSGGKVTVSRANLLSSGAFIAYNTALAFKTAIFTGTASFRINGLGKKESQLYVFREDGLGVIANDRYNNVDTGIEKTPSRDNGATIITHGQFIYYSWLHSIVRVYGSSHDDIGDDYRGVGLPDGREGVYSDADSYLKLLFFSINAGGSGTSSVLAWDGLGWHEVLRAPYGRAKMCKVQTCPGTRNRLWTNIGDDLVFQELPLNKASPRLDSGARFQHEGVLVSSAIDMGTASGLAKFIKELTVTVRNLNSNGREIFVDVQTDADVFTNTWTPVGTATRSPESTIPLNLENVRRFAYRLRMCTNDNATPVDVEGVVPNGYARVPFKMIFTLQVQAGGIYSRRGKSATAGELTRWLLDQARTPGRVRMTSVYELAHGWNVILHPPRMFPMVPRKGRNSETASLTLVLQEI